MEPTHAAAPAMDISTSVALAIKAAGPRLTVRVSGDAPAVPSQLGRSIGKPPAAQQLASKAAPNSASADPGSAQTAGGPRSHLLGVLAKGGGALKRRRGADASELSRADMLCLAGAGQPACNAPMAQAPAAGVQPPASPHRQKRGRGDDNGAVCMLAVPKEDASRRKRSQPIRAEN